MSSYLKKLFDSDGEFRLMLTQSEDYILQSALSLLNAQQAIISELSKSGRAAAASAESPANPRADNGKTHASPSRSAIPYSIGATAVGGVIGGVVIGTWGAVFGSIAGTALALYYVASADKAAASRAAGAGSGLRTVSQPAANPAGKLDVGRFVQIVSNICESIDNLIDTFRAQIKRVVDKYESQPKPAIETNFRSVLEGIQSLLGYKRTHTPDEEKYVAKLQQRVEDVAELLDNYNLEAVDFSGDNIGLFEQIASPTAERPKMVVPAIVRDGVAVIKGKVFVPETSKE